jgi:hypothetical protein
MRARHLDTWGVGREYDAKIPPLAATRLATGMRGKERHPRNTATPRTTLMYPRSTPYPQPDPPAAHRSPSRCPSISRLSAWKSSGRCSAPQPWRPLVRTASLRWCTRRWTLRLCCIRSTSATLTAQPWLRPSAPGGRRLWAPGRPYVASWHNSRRWPLLRTAAPLRLHFRARGVTASLSPPRRPTEGGRRCE